MPDTTKCEGTAVATCGVDGYWDVAVDCPTVPANRYQDPVCDNGVCGLQCQTGRDNCDGLDSNGCEVSLVSAPHHCGFCERDCLEGSCSNGICSPKSVDIRTASAHYVAVDENNIYWTDLTNEKVQYRTKTSSTIYTLAQNQPSPRWLTLADNTLYWSTLTKISGTNYGSILARPLTGSNTVVVSLQQGFGTLVRPITADSQYVYWPNSLGTISKTTVDGSLTTEIDGSSYKITSMVSSGSSLWWVLSDFLGQIMKASGGSVEVEADGQVIPFDTTYKDGNLFWTNVGDSGTPGSVMRLDTTTGTPTILASDEWAPRWVTADSQWVYWSSRDGIRAVPVEGGTVLTLGSNSVSVYSKIVENGDYVYLASQSGLLCKVAKQPL